MLGFSFSSKLDQDSYVASVAKTASKKIRALNCCLKLLSPEVVSLEKMFLKMCSQTEEIDRKTQFERQCSIYTMQIFNCIFKN